MNCPMHCRYLTVAAIIANVLLIGAALFVMANAYGRDIMFAGLLAVPPLLSIIALLKGPDKEQRELERAVAKARLRAELTELEARK